MSDTHSQAHTTISNVSETNSGPAFEALIERWAQVSNTHLQELVEACHVLAGSAIVDTVAGSGGERHRPTETGRDRLLDQRRPGAPVSLGDAAR
jgi:hypothetical protein